jgi:hypothetical protein
MLAKSILTLNYCRRSGKEEMRCYTYLLNIWIVSHIETRKPIFNIFLWFNQNLLKLVDEEE